MKIDKRYRLTCPILRLSLLAFLSVGQLAMGESLEEYLKLVENNNPFMKVASVNAEALSHELSAGNRLEPVSIEYSPFFRRGEGGTASSELIIQQEFDFPTAYTARSKETAGRVRTANMEGTVARRDLLLEAKLAYIDAVYAVRSLMLARERCDNADKILELTRKMADNGVATSLDINMAQMEVMTGKSAVAQAEGNMHAAFAIMEGFSGKREMVADVDYPALPRFSQDDPSAVRRLADADPVLAVGRSEIENEDRSVSVARNSLLPKIAVGYRRNTEGREAVNGFLVGLSLPVYSGNAAVKAALLQRQAKTLELETETMRIEGGLTAKNAECYALQESLAAYNLEIMKESLRLLGRSVELRNMSLTDYFQQANDVYDKIGEYLEVENRLQKAAAELTGNTL